MGASEADHNSLGKAAFGLGALALLMAFVPVVGFASWLLAPLAIIFGVVALRKPRKSFAIAGMIAGGLALMVCFWWVGAANDVGRAMNSDTFNTTGEAQDLADAPILDVSVTEVWDAMEANRVAAGQRYGGHRLRFSGEVIDDFGGNARSPSIQFEAARRDYFIHYVIAGFSEEDGSRIGQLSKGDRVSFTCTEISEGLAGGYSLAGCRIDPDGADAGGPTRASDDATPPA